MKYPLLLLLFPLMMFAQDSPLVGDVDCDGEVNSQDASLILQFVTGVIDELPCQDNMTGLTPEQLQEIINMMDEQLNINYSGSFPIEGWIDHDYQSTWCYDSTEWPSCQDDPVVNIASKSGIILLNSPFGFPADFLIVVVNGVEIMSANSGNHVSSFPIKQGDEFIIYDTSMYGDLSIHFFSFGDAEGSSSTNSVAATGGKGRCDILYPEGFGESVTFNNQIDDPYIIPDGKRLYV